MLAKSVSSQFHEALKYASELHAGQVRKGTEIPYVAHLLGVTSIVLEAGGTEEEAIAALLHDGPEDQGGRDTLQKIRRDFGDRVADIVEHCSDTFEQPKPPWSKRKADYVKRLRDADRSVLLVSLADKLHNARSTLRDVRSYGIDVFRRFSATREETLQNYRNLLAVYETGATDQRRDSLVEELRSTLDALDALTA